MVRNAESVPALHICCSHNCSCRPLSVSVTLSSTIREVGGSLCFASNQFPEGQMDKLNLEMSFSDSQLIEPLRPALRHACGDQDGVKLYLVPVGCGVG